jgi:lysozyme family protein
MIENFEQCLTMLLHHEGGFVNHPKDPGGMTNLGVTKKVYEEYLGREVTEDEMRALTQEDVAPLYKKNYWDRVRGDDLPSGLDWSVFDWAVNSGPARSARALQTCIGATPDGAIGPNTLKQLSKFNPKEVVYQMLRSVSLFTRD